MVAAYCRFKQSWEKIAIFICLGSKGGGGAGGKGVGDYVWNQAKLYLDIISWL